MFVQHRTDADFLVRFALIEKGAKVLERIHEEQARATALAVDTLEPLARGDCVTVYCAYSERFETAEVQQDATQCTVEAGRVGFVYEVLWRERGEHGTLDMTSPRSTYRVGKVFRDGIGAPGAKRPRRGGP